MVRFRDLRHQRPVRNLRPFSKRPRCCLWCGRPFSRTLRPTREHLLPRSLGGGGGQNLAAACSPCNQARGASLDWRPYGAPLESLPTGQRDHLLLIGRLIDGRDEEI